MTTQIDGWSMRNVPELIKQAPVMYGQVFQRLSPLVKYYFMVVDVTTNQTTYIFRNDITHRNVIKQLSKEQVKIVKDYFKTISNDTNKKFTIMINPISIFIDQMDIDFENRTVVFGEQYGIRYGELDDLPRNIKDAVLELQKSNK